MKLVHKDTYRVFGLFLLAMVLLLSGCGSQQSPELSERARPESAEAAAGETVELTISAAASVTDALLEIEKAYESKNQRIQLNLNFGASGALQQQMEQGAPVDVFLSAAPKNMKALVDKQLIDPKNQAALLTNELVVITPADAKTAIRDLTELTKAEWKRVAIGIPESVPAGSYAKEALVNGKLWDALSSKMVQAKDVRQVLHYVETGNADIGFVYKTDALTSKRVNIAFAVDSAAYTPVTYPLGLVKASKHTKEAAEFYNYLQSKEAMDIFINHGFSAAK
ncbi:molybdate ABC transporter substrate-binding protein [Paenibacillus turpanensis]|uniref:molybdate ABC transporter substrate-binding protein n=1 Tax=Paenibacillus turpanensis TaxID=2689078 RepID=UPI003C7BA097